MNSPDPKDLPTSYAEAYARLNAAGRDRNYRSMSYRMVGVSSVFVEERYHSAMVHNPKHDSFLGSFFAPRYVLGRVRGLSQLYVDGTQVGPLHGGSDSQAAAIQHMLASGGRKVDLVVSGHFTEAGWFVDSLQVVEQS